jgi:hypothetical protein
MMNFTVYNPETGEILYNLTCNDQTTADVNLTNCNFIQGTYSGELYYIENNQPIAKTTQLDTNLLAQSVRKNRNQQLDIIDRINPVWYSSLTTEQQSDLVVYRQQLLDVPQQAGFPTQVEWPSKPVWL